LIIKSWN